MWFDDANLLLNDFLDSLRKKKDIYKINSDHLKSLAVVDACIKSSKTGKKVSFASKKTLIESFKSNKVLEKSNISKKINNRFNKKKNYNVNSIVFPSKLNIISISKR